MLPGVSNAIYCPEIVFDTCCPPPFEVYSSCSTFKVMETPKCGPVIEDMSFSWPDIVRWELNVKQLPYAAEVMLVNELGK